MCSWSSAVAWLSPVIMTTWTCLEFCGFESGSTLLPIDWNVNSLTSTFFCPELGNVSPSKWRWCQPHGSPWWLPNLSDPWRWNDETMDVDAVTPRCIRVVVDQWCLPKLRRSNRSLPASVSNWRGETVCNDDKESTTWLPRIVLELQNARIAENCSIYQHLLFPPSATREMQP